MIQLSPGHDYIVTEEMFAISKKIVFKKGDILKVIGEAPNGKVEIADGWTQQSGLKITAKPSEVLNHCERHLAQGAN